MGRRRVEVLSVSMLRSLCEIFGIMKLLFFLPFCWLIGPSSNAYADLHGDQLVDQYLNRSARHDAVLSVRVDYQEPKKEPVRLEVTWMRKVKPELISHRLRIDAPFSEKGKLLLVHEKANGACLPEKLRSR
jgi:hypothetical protein